MAYTKVNWTESVPINATNLNKMDQGIQDVETLANHSHPYLAASGTAVNSTLWNNVKRWQGTQAQYDAITTKDSTTVYFIL